jgi:hypothetical protein
MISSVSAMANTPSENASRRALAFDSGMAMLVGKKDEERPRAPEHRRRP